MFLMPTRRDVHAEFAPLLPFPNTRRVRPTYVAVVAALSFVALLGVLFGRNHSISQTRTPEGPSFMDKEAGAAKRSVEEASSSHTSSFLEKKKKEKSDEDMCPGCTDPSYRCVVANDGTFAQCIDCSPYGNWQNDCPVWGESLRIAAVEKCGLACGDLRPPKGTYPAVEPYCHIGSLVIDYSHKRCTKMDDDSIQASCESKDPNECGLQLSSTEGTGSGTYSVAIQAARGAGLSSRLYLYTYGFGKDRRHPWNEISFDVLGTSCSKNKTLISTDLVAGPFNKNAQYWNRETSYQEYIWVPFDACADWHTYTLSIKNNTILWKVDGVVYRSEDISSLDDLVEALYERNLQTRLALVGQDETAGKWNEMGFLSQNQESFPLSAWFANLAIYEDDGTSTDFENSDYVQSENVTGASIKNNGSSKYKNLSNIPENITKSRMQFLLGNITPDIENDRSSDSQDVGQILKNIENGESSDSEDVGHVTKDDEKKESSDFEDVGKIFESIHGSGSSDSEDIGHTHKSIESDGLAKSNEKDGSTDSDDVGKIFESIHSSGTSDSEDLDHTHKSIESDGSSHSKDMLSTTNSNEDDGSSDSEDVDKIIESLRSSWSSDSEDRDHTHKSTESDGHSKDIHSTTKSNEDDGSSDSEDVDKIIERIHSSGSSDSEDLDHTHKSIESDGHSKDIHSTTKSNENDGSSDSEDVDKIIDSIENRASDSKDLGSTAGDIKNSGSSESGDPDHRIENIKSSRSSEPEDLGHTNGGIRSSASSTSEAPAHITEDIAKMPGMESSGPSELEELKHILETIKSA